MKKQMIIALILLIVVVFFATEAAVAQKDSTKLKQEVEVTKAYQPTIQEAVKINDIPKIKPEQTGTPTFDYSIFSKPVFSTFDLTPITAAKMVGDAKPERGNGLLKLGLGNYLTPYGELFFNNQPDKSSIFGIHIKHLSSSGKIKLLNDDKVSAPESDNEAEIFGKKFFHGSTLSGSLAFDRTAFNYYGYSGDKLTDDQKTQMIPYFGNKQYFSKGTADVHLKSETKSAFDFGYDFGINYHYLVSKTGQSERETNLTGDFHEKFGQTFAGLNIGITYYKADSIWNRFSDKFGKKQQILVKINPSAMWKTNTARLLVGLNSNLVFDDDTDASFLVWPNVKAEWSPVPNGLTLFAGIDGYLKHNTYSVIAAENPYVDPYHDVANTNFKSILSGGFKGKIGLKTNFVAEATYSTVKDQHFFYINVNEVPVPGYGGKQMVIYNTFNWIYDDLNILKLSGEVLHSVSDNFSLHLSGNYYSYDLKSQQKAWQMPNFDLTFSGIYKPTEQLKFSVDLFVIGNRTALIFDNRMSAGSYNPYNSIIGNTPIQMDPIIDLNAGGEYQFSKSLSFFGKLNNFGFQKYEQWLGYTSKGLNWLAGISYSF